MQSIIQTTLYLLTILIPLTFTTINSELFEFPKFILLLSGTLVITGAMIIDHFVQQRRFSFKPTLLNLSVLIFLSIQLLATFTSINPYTSFWGYYSRFHQGLLTTICFTIIYFSAIFYLDKKSVQKLIRISVGTAFFVSLYAILQHFGIDKKLWIQDVVNRPFSTLGQPNWLAAYLIPNYFLTLLFFHQKSKANNVLFTMYSVLIFTALILTRSRSGLLAFALSYVAYYLLLIRQLGFAKIKHALLLHTTYYILVASLVGTAYTPSLTSLLHKQPAPVTSISTTAGTQLENGGTESGDIRKIVWLGALQLIKKYPILGTGPETFAYTYYWVRPNAHNNTSEWDFIYNKAHNEYLNIAATTGLLGLLSYLLLHISMFATSMQLIPSSKKIDQESASFLRTYYPVLGASVVGFGVTSFFGFSVIPVYLLFILFAAFPQAVDNPNSNEAYQLHTTYYILIFIPLFYPLRLFLADTNYTHGKYYLDASKPTLALPYLQKAVGARPGLDLYHSALGETYALLGQRELALKEADLTRQLNPYHLNYHKSRAKIYLTLAGSDPSYYTAAAKEIEDARKLAPTDPKLAYNLGLVYTRMGKNEEAAEQLRAAITLKPDYESPYYALTLLYEQTNQKDLVPDLLKSAKTNLATYSSALREKVETYQK